MIVNPIVHETKYASYLDSREMAKYGNTCYACGKRAEHKAVRVRSGEIVAACSDHSNVIAPTQICIWVRGRKGDPVALFDMGGRIKPAFADRRGPQPQIGEVWRVRLRDTRAGKIFIAHMVEKLATPDRVLVQTAESYVPSMLPYDPVIEGGLQGFRRSKARVFVVDNARAEIERYATKIASGTPSKEKVDTLRRIRTMFEHSPTLDADTFRRIMDPLVEKIMRGYYLEEIDRAAKVDNIQRLVDIADEAASDGFKDVAIKAERLVVRLSTSIPNIRDVDVNYDIKTYVSSGCVFAIVNGAHIRCRVDRENNIAVVPADIRHVTEDVRGVAHYGDEVWDTGRTHTMQVKKILRPKMYAPIPEEIKNIPTWHDVEVTSCIARDGYNRYHAATDSDDNIIAVWSDGRQCWVTPKPDVNSLNRSDYGNIWKVRDSFDLYRAHRIMAARQGLILDKEKWDHED